MNGTDRKMELLGSAPIPKALLALGLPTMIGMMINALYNLVDAYFVGGLGTSQMGAITVAYPLGQVVVGLGLLFGNGAASYLSRLLGRGEKNTADKVASTALYSSITVGAAVIICSLLFLSPLLKLLGATESIMPYAVSYTGIYIASSIFNVFNVTMNNIVSSEGAAKTTMCVLMTGAILNVILDPLFIYGLQLGVAGAAIATALSQLVSTLVYLCYIFRKKKRISLSYQGLLFFQGNHVGNIENRNSHSGIPAADKPVHYPHQQHGKRVWGFRTRRNGAGDADYVCGKPYGIRLYQRLPAYCRLQLRLPQLQPSAGSH